MVLIHCLLSFIGCSLWMFNSIPASKISCIMVYEQSVAPRDWRSWGYANRPSIVHLLLRIRVFVSNNNNVCVASLFNVSWANPCIYDRSLWPNISPYDNYPFSEQLSVFRELMRRYTYTLFQNGRHFRVLFLTCKLTLVASVLNSKFKRIFPFKRGNKG